MKYLIWAICLLVSTTVIGQRNQDATLAQQYLRNGEYEKAKVLYEKLHKKQPNSDYYFSRYLECIVSLEEYKEAEKVLKKQIKKNPKKVQLFVSYGNLYERQLDMPKADEQYRKAIKQLPADRYQITRLANEFIKLTKYDLALEAYQKGNKLLKDKFLFAYELADLYRRMGKSTEMVENYLNSLTVQPQRLPSIKTLFQRSLGEEDYKELQQQLYTRIQENPNETIFVELLTWVFLQKKDYKNALRQAKALDRRLEENGGRIYRLGTTAANEKDYDAAILAYDYIIEKKGKTNTYYLDAKRESLKCKRNKLVSGFDYTKEDLLVLETEYETFLNEFGRNKNTGKIIYELADLEAFYLNNLDKAISLLDSMLAYPGLHRHLKAETKISLADFYLMRGEIWESTLLYSQVDKDFKEDVLGQMARFKNAKLSYYNGDFEWAQGQFNVLKASTSKLIANDALDLSVFIMDNLALDTTPLPTQMYAAADLLAFQNKTEEAFEKLTILRNLYPKHALEDDILYAEAHLYLKERDVNKAVEKLQEIIDNHPKSIRLDNSLFELAELYEKHLKDNEKAKNLYEKIILDHSGSTYAVKARKRYRILNGEKVE